MSEAAAQATPELLKFHLGDGRGGAQRFTWAAPSVHCDVFKGSFEKVQEKLLTPDAAQWEHFWQALAQQDVWQWQPRYGAPDAEGIAWSLELRHGPRSLAASGTGSFPPDFDRFKLAFWRLLGNPMVL